MKLPVLVLAAVAIAFAVYVAVLGPGDGAETKGMAAVGPTSTAPAVLEQEPGGAVATQLRSPGGTVAAPDAGSAGVLATLPSSTESEDPSVPEEAPLDPDVLRVRGRVVDGEGAPIAGANVFTSLAVGIQQYGFAEASSGAEGHFELEASYAEGLREALREVRLNTLRAERALRQSEAASGAGRQGSGRRRGPGRGGGRGRGRAGPGFQDAAIVIVAEFPGYQIGLTRADLPTGTTAESRTIDVEIVLRPGTTLTGLVVVAGQPVSEAEVMLIDDRYEVLDRTLTSPEGLWFLGAPDRSVVRLFARREGQGTGLLENPDLISPGRWAHVIELFGTGQISGQVVYPDGHAATGVLLTVDHEELVFEGAVGETRRIAFERDRGLSGGRVLSDGDGEFEIQGLIHGRFRIAFATLTEPGLQPTELVSTTDGRVELVYAAHRVRVLVEGEGVDLSEARVSLAPLVHGEDGNLGPGANQAAEGLRGRLFVVEPGRDYVVRASAPGAWPLETIVLVPSFPYETTVEFDLFPEDETPELVERVLRRMYSGRVQVDARAPSGAGSAGWTASLTAVSPGLAFAELTDVTLDGEGRLPEVPAGVWKLTARPPADAEGWLLPVTEPLEVVVRSGADSRVPVHARVGGRLRLELDATLASGNARLTVGDPVVPGDSGDPVGPVLRHGMSASVRPAGEKEAAWTELSFFEVADTNATDGRRLLPGHAATCDPALAAGDWVLRLDAPGLAAREVPFAIAQRETTDLAIEK